MTAPIMQPDAERECTECPPCVVRCAHFNGEAVQHHSAGCLHLLHPATGTRIAWIGQDTAVAAFAAGALALMGRAE